MKDKTAIRALNQYLKASRKESVYLSFPEIEQIINQPLPDKAYQSKGWWYNRSNSPQAEAWLSASYRVVDHKDIVARHGVRFEKFTREGFRKYIYSKAFFSLMIYFVLPVVVGIVIFFISQAYSKSIERKELISNSLQIIELYYEAGNFESLDKMIYELIPTVKKEHDNILLCRLYSYLFSIEYSTLDMGAASIDWDKVNCLIEIGKEGLNIANKIENSSFIVEFNLNIGKVYKLLFDKSCDNSNADLALEYLCEASKEIAEMRLKPISTEEGMHKAMMTLEIDTMGCNIILTQIENLALLDFEGNTELGPGVTNLVSKLLVFLLLNEGDRMIIKNEVDMVNMLSDLSGLETVSLENYPNFDPLVYQQSIDVSARFETVAYLICFKHNVDSFGGISPDGYEETIEILQEFENYAKSAGAYDLLSNIYFDIIRVAFYSCMYEGNDNAMIIYNKYMNLWQNLSGQENISLIDYDKQFETISQGSLLDQYITEEERMLRGLSFSNNPSFYAFTSWDLAKHYIYKANQLMAEDVVEDNDMLEITMLLDKASKSCETALIYFTEERNQVMYLQLTTMLTDISARLSLR